MIPKAIIVRGGRVLISLNFVFWFIYIGDDDDVEKAAIY